MKEEWRPVIGYGDYEVSSHGRVRSLDRTIQCKNGQTQRRKGRVLKPRKHVAGYFNVQLCKEGKPRNNYVHRLVLEAFVGPCPEGAECLHGDGNPENNRLDNLRWGSSSDNKFDIVRHGRHHWANKTFCSRAHEYISGNLVKSEWKNGWRKCLACERARSYLRGHPELRDQFQEIADKYYEAILEESTDAPVIARSRNARGIMDRRRNERNEQQ